MSGRSLSIERIAESQFMIRPMLKDRLASQELTDDARKLLGKPYKNYYELWTGSLSDKFHDMTTMIRLGAAIEEELRNVYMHTKGHVNLSALKADTDYRRGAFQRIQPWQIKAGTAQHTLNLVGYNLFANSQVTAAQRTMLHRNLYAHNIGLIDEDYIINWLRLTSEDIAPIVASLGYPTNDTYWFRPLDELDGTIENLRKFVRELPQLRCGTDN
jgi:hypothetical protein